MMAVSMPWIWTETCTACVARQTRSALLPNKRLKLAGALVVEEVVGSHRTRDLRPPLLRRRAGRPQLKRDPLGSAIEMSYVVAIVAHPDFEPLIPLAERVHVWLADTSANRTRAQNYWRAHPQNSIEQGVTTFKVGVRDRKSTRLNSSHPVISYAVFCLKKKKKKNMNMQDTIRD